MGHREPTDQYLSAQDAKQFYDRFGAKQDWQHFYENSALDELIAHAAFDSAQSVLEFGCGTGSFAARLFQRYLREDARHVGVDISETMIGLARERLKLWPERARVYQTDGGVQIPEPDRGFDRFVSTYVFDLLAPDVIEQVLSEAHRLLVPGGKLCLVSLTFGASHFSRVVSWTWQRLWHLSPAIVGGCRPLELLVYLPSERWQPDYHATVTNWGISSEILVASSK